MRGHKVRLLEFTVTGSIVDSDGLHGCGLRFALQGFLVFTHVILRNLAPILPFDLGKFLALGPAVIFASAAPTTIEFLVRQSANSPIRTI